MADSVIDNAEVGVVEKAEIEGNNDVETGEALDIEAAADSIGADLFDKGEKETEDEPIEAEAVEEAEVEEQKEETDEEVTAEKTEEAEEDIEAPASWKKIMREKFAKMDKEDKEYILLREKQMEEGLDKDRNDAVVGRTMRDITAPYEALLSSEGSDPQTAIKNLLGAHYRLRTGSQADKQAIVQNIIRNYGVDTNGEQPVQPQTNPELAKMRQELNQLKSQRQQEQQKIQADTLAQHRAEVDEFASDPANEFFDDVLSEVSLIVEHEKRNKREITLKEAYARALRMNPMTAQRMEEKSVQDRLSKAQGQSRDDVARAKGAKVTNIKSKQKPRTSSTGKAGSLNDLGASLSETFDLIQSRRN